LQGSRYATREQVRKYLEITAAEAVTAAIAQALQDLDDATLAHVTATDNPHSVTKDQVGLGNVDNTSDLSKPISTLTQAALDEKADHGWVDIDFPLIIRTTGANRPVLTVVRGNVEAPLWAVNDFVHIEGQEIIHGYLAGSDIQWHVHMITAGTNADDRYVNLEVEWVWANPQNELSATITTTSGDLLIPANTPDRTMLVRQIALVSVPTMVEGAHVWARLRRIASTGAAPTGGVFISMLQLHVNTNKYGLKLLPGYIA
jgi:hypothetical protein